MRILLTGSAGFIGAHTVEHLLETTDWEIIGVDSLKHKGRWERVEPFLGPRYTFVKADLAKEQLPQYGADVIINMASESHVDRSIDDPQNFMKNNIDLTMNMLEYARYFPPKMFIQISTDEVYGPMVNRKPHPEWDSMLPSNPYSASKAAQEDMCIAYWRTYGLPLVITNTMNNFGERQDVEKFIPNTIKKILNGETVQVHGNKRDIGSRFYLHARNHADALRFIIERDVEVDQFRDGFPRPMRFNIVGDKQVNNLKMAQGIAEVLNKDLNYELVDFHSTRPGHDPHYGLDGRLLRKLGWKPPVSFEASMRKTIAWTLEHKEWLQ